MKQIKASLLFLSLISLFSSCIQEKQGTSTLVLEADLAMNVSTTIVSIPIEVLTARGMPSNLDKLWHPFNVAGKAIPAQYEDLDLDGKPEGLIMEAIIGEALAFQFPATQGVFPMRTNLHIGKRRDSTVESVKQAVRLKTDNNKITYANFQYEGIGWENDIVGFRNYLDLRNGIDIFGKRVPDMVLDEVDKDQNSHYHELGSWGMDILKVGTSLGAGSIGLIY